MHIKTTAVAFLFILFACNESTQTESNAVKTETTTSTDDDAPAGDKEAQKKALNDRSRACIALMNSLEVEQNAAYAAGDAVTAKAIKARIDSAARENVLIGQQLMDLDK